MIIREQIFMYDKEAETEIFIEKSTERGLST